MFDKETFSKILNEIYKTYNNQRDFADAAGVNRAYLSQYINKKLDNPPSPKILKKIATASNGITTYNELMFLCEYTNHYQNVNVYSESERLFNKLSYELKELKLTDDEIEQLKDILLFNTQNNNSNISVMEFTSTFPDTIKSKILNFYNKFVDKKYNSTVEVKDTVNSIKYYNIPVYGQIAAGLPNWAEECLESCLPVDLNMMSIVNPEECFFLRVNGESMNKVIRNGAYALIRKQDIVENGEIAAVLVNGDSATIKKFTQRGDVIVLEPMSDDSSFQTQIYDKNTTIKILGKYIGKFEINN